MLLLASVVCASEAHAIHDVADVVDIKDVSKGAFGAPDVAVVEAARESIGEKGVLSVALGEMDAAPENILSLATTMAKAGADVLKIAVYGAGPEAALSTLSTIKDSIPYGVKLVAAVYADVAGECSITPFDLPFIASAAGADGILIDTRRKNGRSLLDLVEGINLKRIVDEAKDLGLTTALAGALGMGDLATLAVIRPDYVGFRSAITVDGERGASVDVEKVARIRDRIKILSLNKNANLA